MSRHFMGGRVHTLGKESTCSRHLVGFWRQSSASKPSNGRVQGRTAGAGRQGPLWVCAVKRRHSPVGARPTRRIAPAGSNRSSHGGNEMTEAFGQRVTNR